jgi:hypothetical protein
VIAGGGALPAHGHLLFAMRLFSSPTRLFASAACAAALLGQRELTRRGAAAATESVGKDLFLTAHGAGPAITAPTAGRGVRQAESALAAQAREFAANLGDSVEPLQEILLTLAQENPRLALELACSSPLRLVNDTPLAGLIAARLADRDPATALLLLRSLDPRTLGGHAAYVAVFDAMGQRDDFVGALQSVGALCAAETQAGFIQRIVLDWCATSPEAALTWIRALPDAAMHDRLLVEAGQSRFALDPAQAAELALQVRDPALRVASLTETLFGWFDADPAGVTQWLDRFPPNADLDHFAARIATLPELSATRIDVALGWAESITQPELRLQSLATLIDNWSRHDAAAATHYISTAIGLTLGERTTLLARARSTTRPGPKG